VKLEGTYTFDAPREVVWAALLDPEVLAKTMPGCERLERTGDNEYQGDIKIKVGPVQGKFQGTVKLSDINELESYSMQVDGKGAPGFVKGAGAVKLEPQGDSTLMHYSGDAQVGGRIASVGQRLLDSSAKAITRQSLDSLNKQIQARHQAPTASSEQSSSPETASSGPTTSGPTTSAPSSSVSSVEAPSQVEFGLGVTRELLNDMISPERRMPLVIGLVVLLVLIFAFILWSS
jgi:carbon monoxide dehydrogenase subunit G